MGCIPNSKEDEAAYTKLMQIGKEWSEAPFVQHFLSSDGGSKEFNRLVETATRGKNLHWGQKLSMAEVNRVQKLTRKAIKSFGKSKPGYFASLFYLPQEVLGKNPLTRRYWDNLINANAEFKGKGDKHLTTVLNIQQTVKEVAGTKSLLDKTSLTKGVSRVKASKDLARAQARYTRKAQTDEPAARAQFIKDKAKIYKTEEGKVILDLYKLMRNEPDEITNIKPMNDSKYNHQLKQAVTNWRLTADELYVDLRNGVKNYKTMVDEMRRKIDNEHLDNLAKSLDLILNELKPDQEYYPSEILHIMPLMQSIAVDLNTDFSKTFEAIKEPNKGIGDMQKKLMDMNKYITKFIDESPIFNKHARKSSHGEDVLESQNVLPVLESYVRHVTRFKYLSTVNKEFSRALTTLWGVAAKGNNEFGDVASGLAEYLVDLHGDVIGAAGVNMTIFRQMIRAATAFEFMSKLGLNFRSAARNATQSIQNYTYFGLTGMMDTYKTVNLETNAELKTRLQKQMENNGIFFAEIEEIAYGKDAVPRYRIDESGQIVQEGSTGFGMIADGLAKIASKSGWSMQKAENFNRHMTYKMAFVKHWKMMHNSGKAQAIVKAKNPGIEGSKLEQKTYDYLEEKSAAFANGVVRKLHFEYATFAKAKILRGEVGNLLGQFQHYGMNFINYQWQIMRGGGESVGEGFKNFLRGNIKEGFQDFKTEEAWMMYRLGILNLLLGGVLNAVTGVSVNNLVQNDTYEKGANLYNILVHGDDPTMNKYGVGITGPAIGDLISLGNFVGLYEMDGEGWLSYLTGYKNYLDMSDDELTEAQLRLLSPAISRLLLDHVPKYANGTDIISLAANEVGLYRNRKPTKKKTAYKGGLQVGQKQKTVNSGLTKEDVLRALQELQNS